MINEVKAGVTFIQKMSNHTQELLFNPPRLSFDSSIKSSKNSRDIIKIAIRMMGRLERSFPKWLVSLLKWIKFNLFACFFDERFEKNQKVANELDKLLNAIYDVKPDDEGKKDIQRRFELLSQLAKHKVEHKVNLMLKDGKSNLTFSDVLDNPFQDIKIHGDDTKIFPAACIHLRDELRDI